MMPVPRVSVRNCERKPIRPRDGMRNSRRTRPLPLFTMRVGVPRRVPMLAMTTPWKSSGTSMTTSSTGSTLPCGVSLVTISGRDTCSSKPSRRIISMRIASCSSPRPTTLNASGESVSSHADRDVADQLLVEAIAQVARGDVLAFAAGERRGVDAEDHRDGRLVDRDRRNRHRVQRIGDRLADGDVLDAGEADDVAGRRLGRCRRA